MDPRAALVARFRQCVENNLRSGWAINRYAKELSVTPDATPCRLPRSDGEPPTRIVHDRLVLEAKRTLMYTS